MNSFKLICIYLSFISILNFTLSNTSKLDSKVKLNNKLFLKNIKWSLIFASIIFLIWLTITIRLRYVKKIADSTSIKTDVTATDTTSSEVLVKTADQESQQVLTPAVIVTASDAPENTLQPNSPKLASTPPTTPIAPKKVLNSEVQSELSKLNIVQSGIYTSLFDVYTLINSSQKTSQISAEDQRSPSEIGEIVNFVLCRQIDLLNLPTTGTTRAEAIFNRDLVYTYLENITKIDNLTNKSQPLE